MELDKKESFFFLQESFNLERGKLREKGRNRIYKNQSGKTKSKFHKFCICYLRGQKMKFLFFLMSLNFVHGSTSSWINCCMVLISQNLRVCNFTEDLEMVAKFISLIAQLSASSLVPFFFSSCHSTNFSPVAVLALPMLLQHISCFNKPSLHYTYTDRK